MRSASPRSPPHTPTGPSAVDFLANAGIDAYSVAGGTAAWTNTGRPVVYGAHERAA